MHPKAMMPCSSLIIGQTGIEIPGGTPITQDMLTKRNGRRVHQKDTMTLLTFKPRINRSIDTTIRRVRPPKLETGPKTIRDIWVNLRTTRKMRQLATVSMSSGRLHQKTPQRKKKRSAPPRSTKRESRTLKKPSTRIPSGMFSSLSNNSLRLKPPRMENHSLIQALINNLLGLTTKMITQTRTLSKKKPRSLPVGPITLSRKGNSEKNCERETTRIQMRNADLTAPGPTIKNFT